MRILIALNHPAHYHLFKNPYTALKEKGHELVFVIKSKDILVELLDSENVPYVVLTKKRCGTKRSQILFFGAIDLLVKTFRLMNFCNKFNPDLLIGTDYSITHVGKLLSISSLVFNEDDYEVNRYFCRLAYPWATSIISPIVCDVGKYSGKKIGYDGYQKLAYLHPNVFKPDINVVRKYIPSEEKYFLIRLVSFSAGHDVEMHHSGIGSYVLEKLCKTLDNYGRVVITSESGLPVHLKKYQLKINPADIHHILAFADLFIADSQSMIVEASILGTPNIRYNSFVGRISVLVELEEKYKLTVGVHVSQTERLFEITNEMVKQSNLREIFFERKQVMLNDKIELTSFIIWLIDNYPASSLKLKREPGYSAKYGKYDITTI